MKIKALTLMELLLAVVLLSMIILGFTTMNTLSYREVINDDRRSKMQGEISYVIDDISKNVWLATGSVNNPGLVVPDNGTLDVRVDLNPSPTADNLADDTWFNYTYDAIAHVINKATDVPAPGVDENIVMTSRPCLAVDPQGFIVTAINDPGSGNIIGVAINLTARLYPAQVKSASNPEVDLKTQALTHSMSTN